MAKWTPSRVPPAVIPQRDVRPRPPEEAPRPRAPAGPKAPTAQPRSRTDAPQAPEGRPARAQAGRAAGLGAGGADSFGGVSARPTATPPLPATPPPALPMRGTSGPMAALKEAKQAGFFLIDESFAEGHREEDEDPELRAAVEEAIEKLFGVRGIHHIGPGRDEQGEPVVVVAAGLGFGESSMKRVPPTFHRFKTAVAVPYELLPLRRDRG